MLNYVLDKDQCSKHACGGRQLKRWAKKWQQRRTYGSGTSVVDDADDYDCNDDQIATLPLGTAKWLD